MIKAVREKNPRNAKQHLESLTKSLEDVGSLAITDKHGTVWSRYPEAPEVIGKNFAFRDWYKGVSRDWTPYVSDLDLRVIGEKDTAIWVVVPVLDEKNTPIGILVSTHRSVMIGNIIKQIPTEQGQSITICDRKGQMIYSSRYQYEKELQTYPFYHEIGKKKKQQATFIEAEDPSMPGQKRYISFSPVPISGGSVFVGRDKRYIFLSEWGYYLQISLISSLIFIIVVFYLFYFRKHVVMQQVVERLKAEETLKRSEERWRELFLRASNAIAVYDAVDDGEDFVFKDLNPAGERIECVKREDIVGKRVTEVFPGVRDFEIMEVFKRVWKTGDPEHFPLSFYKDNRISGWRDNYIFKLNTGEVVAVYEDATARKQAEDEIRNLNIELEQRVRDRTANLEALNKELEAFSYSVSHDLRAPLRSISGFSQIFLDEYYERLDQKGRDYIKRINAASKRMAELIDDLLKLSRVTRAELHYEKINMSLLANTIKDEFISANPERRLRFKIAEDMFVIGDPHLVRIALENLMSNAFKFTRLNPDAYIELGVIEYRGRQAFFISDNGVGFDMEFADKLFNPFQRLHSDREFEGTGVGLAIVQRIIHKHGGEIWAEAEPGKGARFYFTFH